MKNVISIVLLVVLTLYCAPAYCSDATSFRSNSRYDDILDEINEYADLYDGALNELDEIQVEDLSDVEFMKLYNRIISLYLHSLDHGNIPSVLFDDRVVNMLENPVCPELHYYILLLASKDEKFKLHVYELLPDDFRCSNWDNVPLFWFVFGVVSVAKQEFSSLEQSSEYNRKLHQDIFPIPTTHEVRLSYIRRLPAYYYVMREGSVDTAYEDFSLAWLVYSKFVYMPEVLIESMYLFDRMPEEQE